MSLVCKSGCDQIPGVKLISGISARKNYSPGNIQINRIKWTSNASRIKFSVAVEKPLLF